MSISGVPDTSMLIDWLIASVVWVDRLYVRLLCPPVDHFDSVILKVWAPLVCFHVKYCGKLNKNCSNLEPNKANSFINDPQCHIKVRDIKLCI